MFYRLFLSLICFSAVKAEKNSLPIIYPSRYKASSGVGLKEKFLINQPLLNFALGRLCIFDFNQTEPYFIVSKHDACELSAAIFREGAEGFDCVKTLKFNWQTLKRQEQLLPYKLKSLSAGERLLVSMYKQQMPIWLKLKSGYDLVQILAHLRRVFNKYKVPAIQGNLLLITVEYEEQILLFCPEQNFFCDILSAEEVDFLHEHFMLIQQAHLITKFMKFQQKILKIIARHKLEFSTNYRTGVIVKILNHITRNFNIKDALLIVLGLLGFKHIQELGEALKKV